MHAYMQACMLSLSLSLSYPSISIKPLHACTYVSRNMPASSLHAVQPTAAISLPSLLLLRAFCMARARRVGSTKGARINCMHGVDYHADACSYSINYYCCFACGGVTQTTPPHGRSRRSMVALSDRRLVSRTHAPRSSDNNNKNKNIKNALRDIFAPPPARRPRRVTLGGWVAGWPQS
ncbi:uncharacterized protein B0I36DRAFT_321348, partial [Microdochium trichocladiopsis]